MVTPALPLRFATGTMVSCREREQERPCVICKSTTVGHDHLPGAPRAANAGGGAALGDGVVRAAEHGAGRAAERAAGAGAGPQAPADGRGHRAHPGVLRTGPEPAGA